MQARTLRKENISKIWQEWAQHGIMQYMSKRVEPQKDVAYTQTVVNAAIAFPSAIAHCSPVVLLIGCNHGVPFQRAQGIAFHLCCRYQLICQSNGSLHNLISLSCLKQKFKQQNHQLVRAFSSSHASELFEKVNTTEKLNKFQIPLKSMRSRK